MKEIILKYLRIFIYSLLLFIVTILGITYITLLNKNFISRQFTKSHYKKVENNIKEEMKRRMISSGISNTVVDDIFTYKDVENSVQETLRVIYENYSYKMNTSQMLKKLEDNIQADLEKHNYKIEDEKGYHAFTSSIINIYTKEFAMLNQVQKLGKYVQLATKIIVIAIAVLLILLLMVLVIKWKIYKRLISSCLFTNSFLILFSIYYVYEKAGLSSTYIFSETFSQIIRKIINNTFLYFKMFAIAYAILGVLIILLFVKGRHKHYHRSPESNT